MIAMRYGSIPIVRATGGLVDTVSEWDASRGNGTGFVFESYQPDELLGAVERGLAAYRSTGEWPLLVRNALHFDASWARSAQEYLDVYDIALSSAAMESRKGVGAP
jgi:starch synthase